MKKAATCSALRENYITRHCGFIKHTNAISEYSRRGTKIYVNLCNESTRSFPVHMHVYINTKRK